jgi:hypothetical protein
MKPSNRLGLQYEAEASTFRKLPHSIIDIHSHIHGEVATPIYAQVAAHYGVGTTYTMTLLHDCPTVQRLLEERIRFIATPNWTLPDRTVAFGKDYLYALKKYHSFGAKIAKFWTAPRIFDASPEPFVTSPFKLTSPLRVETMKAAMDLGMIFMAHVADPDTWFSTMYRDSQRYGTKHEQYEVFEEALERFPIPWIAAHMGGSPEDLDFLSTLLERHRNLYLDCSATKWIVRELSKHPPEKTRAFFVRWKGRILFGSDIVTSDAHLHPESNSTEMDAKASSSLEAYDLYASRYWALRTLFETDYVGESPIADPDLHMVEPERYSPHDAPQLRGCNLPDDALDALYFEAARKLLGH